MPSLLHSTSKILNKHIIYLWLAVYSSCLFCPTFAQAPINQSKIPLIELKATEQKLLEKAFTQDPIEKRLQRLELLLFGNTQYGSDLERWENIELALKHRQGYLSEGFETNGQIGSAAKRSLAVTQLERQVLKKSYPNESVLARLNRLEQKLFGQPSPAMSTDRRIDRLQKTTGLAGTYAAPPTAVLPMPGMGQNGSPFVSPFGIQPFPNLEEPNLGTGNPFDMLREMDKQMRQFNRQFEGEDGTTIPNLPMQPNFPNNGQFQFHYYFIGPDGKVQEGPNNFKNTQPKNPHFPGQTSPLPRFEDVPPYSDPNMI